MPDKIQIQHVLVGREWRIPLWKFKFSKRKKQLTTMKSAIVDVFYFLFSPQRDRCTRRCNRTVKIESEKHLAPIINEGANELILADILIWLGFSQLQPGCRINLSCGQIYDGKIEIYSLKYFFCSLKFFLHYLFEFLYHFHSNHFLYKITIRLAFVFHQFLQF